MYSVFHISISRYPFTELHFRKAEKCPHCFFLQHICRGVEWPIANFYLWDKLLATESMLFYTKRTCRGNKLLTHRWMRMRGDTHMCMLRYEFSFIFLFLLFLIYAHVSRHFSVFFLFFTTAYDHLERSIMRQSRCLCIPPINTTLRESKTPLTITCTRT